MKWLEQTLANQAQVITHLHSQSDNVDLALVCSDLELIAWNGQTEQCLPLREVKKFSREGLNLLVFDASGEALRLPILSAPRAEIDAFFVALKPAIAQARVAQARVAQARVAQPVAPKAVEAAPIAAEFKLELSPEPVLAAPSVQTSHVVPQAKPVVLEPEKELSFDLGPLMTPASTPATPAPRMIAEPAPQAEMVFDPGPLITPVSAPKPASKPVPVPQAKVESAPVLEPKIEPKIEPALEPEIKPVFAEEAVQAWPDVFAEHIEPVPVKTTTAAMQATSPAQQPVQPMPERSSPQQLQASASSTSAANSSLSAMAGPEAEVAVPVGRDQVSTESKKPEMFDPLFDVPRPKRELPPRVLAQNFGNGLFMHENGFKYQLASIGERFLAMLVDSFLMGIVNCVLSAITLSSVNAHWLRLAEISRLEASTTDATKRAALTLEHETLIRDVPGEIFQAMLLSAFLTLIFTWLYSAFFESGPKQATPGKILMKIGVTDLNIAKVSFWQATRRFAWRIGPFYVTLMIAFLSAGSQLSSGIVGALLAASLLMIWVVISVLLLVGGLLAAVFTKRRQAAHDLLAQTLVVKA